MIQTLLIPLDGSEHSDAVLEDVRQLLIELGGVQVTLLRVVEPYPWPGHREERPSDGHDHVTLRREAAERHLERTAETLREAGAAEVTCKVVLGDPALEILRAAQARSPDLIAMATHGRTGPSRWLRGSVAERILRAITTPLLLVNPRKGKGQVQGTRFRRILLPLDGSEVAASALPLAETFAHTYGAEILLARITPPPVVASAEVPYPMVVPSIHTPEESAKALAPLRERLTADGLRARVVTRQGHPASELLAVVEEEEVDLVVMTSHGTSGVDRWLFGSVAETVVRACPVPLLILRQAESRDPVAGEPLASAEQG
jgi:nucleotide-binding universal stress UspA family protein